MIIGLTGSIGMGKSTVAALFGEAGVPVFDADATVHRLQGAGGALLAPIAAAFPQVMAGDAIDRAALGALVFNNPQARVQLESIVYPALAAARADFVETHAAAPIMLFDIPLLFEKGGNAQVDVIVVVSAPAAIQRSRVLARPGMTPATFAAILALQVPDAEKRAAADFVIDNGGALADTRVQVNHLLACLTARKRG
jgi:dephospho-CoA kinase